MSNKSADWDPSFKQPGALKARLCLFWSSNYGDQDTSRQVLDYAEKLLGEHGIGFDVYPGKVRTAAHTVKMDDRIIEKTDYNNLRCKMGEIFDDQKTTDKRQRLPVLFCQFRQPGNGLTVLRDPTAIDGSPWLPYVLIGPNLDPDYSQLIHEIGHAATESPNHLPVKGNIMHESPFLQTRNTIVKTQVQTIARSYFVKP